MTTCPDNSSAPVSELAPSGVETKHSVLPLDDDLLSEMTCGSGCQEGGKKGDTTAPNFLTLRFKDWSLDT